MTSISSISGYQPQSPLDALENELSSEVTSGTISSSDQSALSTALTSINNSLQSDASSSTSPGDVKSKINDLIQAQVQNGTLTSSQATELQNVFSSTFAQGPGGGGAVPGSRRAGRPRWAGRRRRIERIERIERQRQFGQQQQFERFVDFGLAEGPAQIAAGRDQYDDEL